MCQIEIRDSLIIALQFLFFPHCELPYSDNGRTLRENVAFFVSAASGNASVVITMLRLLRSRGDTQFL